MRNMMRYDMTRQIDGMNGTRNRQIVSIYPLRDLTGTKHKIGSDRHLGLCFGIDIFK